MSVQGAFANSHNCYYWTDGYDAYKQGWRITKVNGGDAGIRNGDKVFLTNLGYTAQKLASDTRNAGYITTLKSSNQWWTVEKI